MTRTRTQTFTRTLLTVVLTAGLLSSGDVCAWLCGTDPAADTSSMASHCAGENDHASPTPATPAAPAEHDEDCGACTVDVTQASGPTDAPSTAFRLALAPMRMLSAVAPARFAAAREPQPADRAPPRDVLAITTTLQV